MRFLHGYKFSTPSGKIQGVQLKDNMIRIFQFSKRLTNWLPKLAVHILHSHRQCMRIPVAPDPHRYLVLAVLWDFDHSDGCVDVSPCLNLHFPNYQCCWVCFPYACFQFSSVVCFFLYVASFLPWIYLSFIHYKLWTESFVSFK